MARRLGLGESSAVEMLRRGGGGWGGGESGDNILFCVGSRSRKQRKRW